MAGVSANLLSLTAAPCFIVATGFLYDTMHPNNGLLLKNKDEFTAYTRTEKKLKWHDNIFLSFLMSVCVLCF